ncbi:MAG: hypothetical protein N2253_07310 [Bacteroidia bacterium]|nr:hypothetical protein [Bacteroidia bacterium]MCX7764679.1 hypothetical protein [Bacteroidia bacterium]MDW8057758.1 hypothetical protein [Bacteroidia bacterium]
MAYQRDAWEKLCEEAERRYGKQPSEEFLLFLVGLNYMGRFPEGDERVVKLNLIQLGTLVLLARRGYVQEVGKDEQGWPHWEPLQALPSWTPAEEQAFLREVLIEYFAEIWEL